MAEFLGFLLIIFVLGWGTAFAALRFRRESNRLGDGADHELMARLLEDMDQLSTRLSRLEEDMDFFKELRSPDTQPRLPTEGESWEGEGAEAGEAQDRGDEDPAGEGEEQKGEGR